MFEAIRNWRRRRTLATAAIPETLWRQALDALPFLAIYTEDEIKRLRERVVVFLSEKGIVGAAGFAVHRHREQLAGESMPGGPVVLSWSDVEAGADWDSAGMNLVIHEFAHKLDMRNGDANGCPPLQADMRPNDWQRTMKIAYEHFLARVESEEDTDIDPYAAESPAEFFAVLSEVFFAEPALLLREYADVYDLLRRYYRQDPARRSELLMDWDHALPGDGAAPSAV